MAKVISGSEFETEVLRSELPVMVDFYAEWCGPCKMLAPAVEELSRENEGKVKIVKVDIDQSSNVAYQYNIRSVPTLMFFKNGEPVDRVIGAVPKAALEERINVIRG
ncbi:MAG: thioredoxin [Clostridiales bacterium]|nr:thioredoxin [Clostridiales bacterium]